MLHLIIKRPYVDEDGERHRIGEVKIGEFDWVEDQGRPNIPKSFETLRDDFFSLGQSAEYYELLRGFGADFCNTILTALNDIALDNALFLRASDESVMGISIMRSVNERTVSGQYRRIINGGAKLTAFDFSYRGPQQLDPEFDPVELAFSVLMTEIVNRRKSRESLTNLRMISSPVHVCVHPRNAWKDGKIEMVLQSLRRIHPLSFRKYREVVCGKCTATGVEQGSNVQNAKPLLSM